MFLIKSARGMSRKLPSWMNTTKSTANVAQLATKPLELEYPQLVIPKTCDIVYSNNLHDCSIICDQIKSQLTSPTVLCLDTEWQIFPQICKTDVIQICLSLEQCYVFQVSEMGEFPLSLKQILEHKNSILTGINLSGDLWKLCRDYEICCEKAQMSQLLDLQKMAKRILNRNNRISLTHLCKTYLQKNISKLQQKSKWNVVPLTNQQINYAAVDVFAAYLLFQKIFPSIKNEDFVKKFSKQEKIFLLYCFSVLP